MSSTTTSARRAHSPVPSAILNKIHEAIVWGVRGNYRSRSPPTAPSATSARAGSAIAPPSVGAKPTEFDLAAFYDKWLTDMGDEQKENGSIPDVAPAYWAFYNDGIVWPSSFAIIPHMLLDLYGDLGVIALALRSDAADGPTTCPDSSRTA